MSELGMLRTMKGAVDEGLITDEDYNSIKVAFVKAMQIRAGVDAGFIQKEDYDRTKDAFLHSLDFTIVGSAPAPPPPPAPVAPARQFPGSINTSTSAAAPAAQPGRPTQLSLAPTKTFARVPEQSNSNNTSPAPRSRPSTFDPTNLPKTSNGITAGKTSLAGISINEQCVDLYSNIKTRSTYKWVTFRINDTGLEVIVDKVGASDSSFSDFVAAFPEDACRYGVFDFQYTKRETGAILQKLIFIHWAPEQSSMKSKMMFSTTKDFFKSFLDGLGAEFQVSEASEISEDDISEKISANMTRK